MGFFPSQTVQEAALKKPSGEEKHCSVCHYVKEVSIQDKTPHFLQTPTSQCAWAAVVAVIDSSTAQEMIYRII